MSIPFFFGASYYEQDGHNDAYCDGGVLNNYPIDTFDQQHTAIDPDSGDQRLHRTRADRSRTDCQVQLPGENPTTAA